MWQDYNFSKHFSSKRASQGQNYQVAKSDSVHVWFWYLHTVPQTLFMLSFNCSFWNWMYIQKSGKALADFIDCWFVFQVRECISSHFCTSDAVCHVNPLIELTEAPHAPQCVERQKEKPHPPLSFMSSYLLHSKLLSCPSLMSAFPTSLHHTHMFTHTLLLHKNLTIKVHMTSNHTIHAKRT